MSSSGGSRAKKNCAAPNAVPGLGFLLESPVLLRSADISGRQIHHGIRDRGTLHRNQGHRLRGRLPGRLHPSEEG